MSNISIAYNLFYIHVRVKNDWIGDFDIINIDALMKINVHRATISGVSVRYATRSSICPREQLVDFYVAE